VPFKGHASNETSEQRARDEQQQTRDFRGSNQLFKQSNCLAYSARVLLASVVVGAVILHTPHGQFLLPNTPFQSLYNGLRCKYCQAYRR
jgi:hypothetical protein